MRFLHRSLFKSTACLEPEELIKREKERERERERRSHIIGRVPSTERERETETDRERHTVCVRL